MADLFGTDINIQSAGADQIIQKVLNQYGLGSLGSKVYNDWIASNNPDLAILNMRNDPIYQARFPAMKLRADNKMTPINETDYMNWEQGAKDLFRSYGLPEGFYDSQDDFTNFIAKGVSVQELGQRVTQGYVAAQNAPDEVKNQLAQYYGVGTGGLAAYYLDPTKALPALQQQFTASQIGAQAAGSAFGGISKDEAERLQKMGVNEQTADQGFGALGQAGELMHGLPGQQANDISRETQLNFVAGDAEAQQALQKVANQRKAEFAGGGSAATASQGVVGLGRQ